MAQSNDQNKNQENKQKERYNAKEAEQKWSKWWGEKGTYKFDPDSKNEIYSIDTPPPTVSGKMHLGHAFSYSQQDFIARFQRMKQKSVFYPFGTDDNGLATERLIEKEKGVKGSKMDRDEFAKLCEDTLKNELRPKYVADWKRIGMSCDWDIFYTTVSKYTQKISQRSFLDLFKKGRIYRKKAPMMICPVCQTAIAQVEVQDEEKSSTLNYIKAKIEETENEYLIYATTRPELLPGCIGMSVKEDGIYVRAKKEGTEEIWVMSKEGFENFKDEWGLTCIEETPGKTFTQKTAIIPLTNVKIKIEHDVEAKTEYGSGVVYWCSYGGAECVDFLTRHQDVEPIHIMDVSGKYNKLAGKYENMRSPEARKQILLDLEEDGSLIKKEKLKHAVPVHERCGTDIEFVATEQWFIKYLDCKDRFLKNGAELNWFPHHMKQRLDNWIKGLKWDWCISRQRFFGVPFPVWYCKDCGETIVAGEEELPINPLKASPKASKCSKCNCTEFIPEKDVLDTWATSSLTPQLAIELFNDHPVKEKLFPMSLRPQAHDIITFWLFNTMVKSQLHYDKNPWENVVISGHAQDPHGRKMSKSKGNVVEPQLMIEKYSADALRFWAAGSKLGDDLPFQEKDLATGQKTLTKLWNAAKFVFMHLEDFNPTEESNQLSSSDLEALDQAMLSKLNRLIKEATESFEKYEYSKTKLEAEKFFWIAFCDNYLEMVKDRLYNPDRRGEKGRRSAQYTLYRILVTLNKLFAPIMPYITEELWQKYFTKYEPEESIHTSVWPIHKEDQINEEKEKLGNLVFFAVEQSRKAKSKASVSLKTPLKGMHLEAKCTKEEFEQIQDDIKAATVTENIEFKALDKSSEKEEECIIEL